MKLIKANFNIIEQDTGIDGIYKIIEQAGRTCYKSEDKITEDSAKEFVDRMIKSGHGAMLEHGTVYLTVYAIAPEDWNKIIARHPRITIDDAREYLRTNPTCNSKGEENWWAKEAKHIALEMAVKYADNPYSKVEIVNAKHDLKTEDGMPMVKKGLGKVISVFNTILITTNLRVLVENNWLDDLKYVCEPIKYHEKRVTVKFICPISISREFNRHRVHSIAEQSTRYCNYSRDKFNKEITFIEPYWYEKADSYTKNEFDRGLQYAEGYYMFMVDKGMKPQEAREILPLCTATELVHTAFVSDWEHFFKLRDDIAAHPQARELAEPLHKEFIKLGYCKE